MNDEAIVLDRALWREAGLVRLRLTRRGTLSKEAPVLATITAAIAAGWTHPGPEGDEWARKILNGTIPLAAATKEATQVGVQANELRRARRVRFPTTDR